MDKASESSSVASPRMTNITVDKSVEFLYEELAKTTDGFSIANIIGQGGLGSVYNVESRNEARYPHIMLKDYFWAAVFAPSEKQFKEAMEKMSKVDNNAAKYLMKTSVDAWARHAFDPASKSPYGSATTSSQRTSQSSMSAQQKLKRKMMEKKSKVKVGMQQKQQGSQQRAQENSQEANQAR
ncbi:putative lysM domain receptor-like kinase 3 isoform X1 [Sesbania bispinosa]|nr:putative lysM domain receptor-like kinase 3 isoform X1 [Sesbania bispinosa]